ncbi:MAG: FAD-dependent oxidoreductase, partial [Actinobacteria bacterium]|nr:FAD-dependent oxidoreductase [Actinomycetota bacterium]
MATAATSPEVVVIGAGPAGLTAAFQLGKRGVACTVLEADSVVGGISRTAERDGWRFDIGGHRFFTKVAAVEAVWHEILSDDDFLTRPRMSRIYYNGKFFDYPLKAFNALAGLGIFEALLCVSSYLWARVRPPKDQSTFEGWVAARFGYRLYRIFFKTYTEKVWGVPCTEIRAEWAAQRIKGLSFVSAAKSAFFGNKGNKIKSLISEFHYPRFGPGQMWETMCDEIIALGGEVRMNTPVEQIETLDGRVLAIHAGGERIECSEVISSLALRDTVRLS